MAKPIDPKETISVIQQRYNNARQTSSLDFERFSRYYKLFRNRQTIKNYNGLANLFIPEPYRIVRKKTAKLANAIRNISITAETPNDVDAAKTGTSLLNFLRRKLNWSITERTAIQESRIVGLSWIKAVWNLEKEKDERPYEGFDLSFVTADKILIDPGSTMLDVFNGEFDWLIHEYEATYEELAENPNYDKQQLDILKVRGGTSEEASSLSQSRLSFQKPHDPKSKKHRVLEYWGTWNMAGKDSNYLIVVADNAIILRNEQNPYEGILDNPIPFVPFVANMVGQELYPIGDIEPAESLFNELNDTRNQRMDTVTLNIDPAKEVLRGANIDNKELIAKKGWVIHSNIPNGIRFISPDMQGVRASIEEETAIRGDIAQVTGVIDFAPGSSVQAGVEIDTARGAIIAKGESDVLVEDELGMLKISLRMLYRIVLSYAQNFLDREFTMRVVERGVESFYNVSKDSVVGNLDLDVDMRTLQDKTTEQQLKLLMFNQAKTVPGANIGRFFTDVLEAFNENVNIDEYYQQPQPQGPEAPKVSISLKGDLNVAEVDEIYKSMGLDPAAADPLMREELRNAMRGTLPENHQNQVNELDLMMKQQGMNQPQENV
jgi:hypothetical protein